MNEPRWTEEDTRKAKEIWAEYQRNHDVSDKIGQAVAIDPLSGRVWFGERAIEAVHAARADGVHGRLFCIRVGSISYTRKGGHR